ncbi:MAG TPA: TPM domain-containing protein [Candidatus Acidoferrum sp.]|nr:TPM domain-containing protein [Candidatus Acidoferrum sp.]
MGTVLGLLCVLSTASPLSAAPPSAQNPDELKPQGYVNDFANVLSPSARTQITQLCTEVDQKAQAQVAVVTVRTLNGQTAFDYSLSLATRWGVGPKQKDRGVMILVAVDDHKYYTQVGYGLEGILPDGKVGGFGREAVPYFRQSNYDAGLLLMTKRVADVIAADRGITLAQEPAVAPPPDNPAPGRSSSEAPSASTELIIVLILLFVVFRVVRAFAFTGSSGRYYRRRSGGWWIGPMIGGFGGGFGGGGWSGGGGGGGGFGGFGGGSFGGGGAGGSW